MKLRALDAIHVSAAGPDTLIPGQEFEVSDKIGEALVKQHPAKFERLANAPTSPAGDAPGGGSIAVGEQKSEPAPQNKSETLPDNKSELHPSNKGGSQEAGAPQS
jgi:hypothetical protein